jgi:carboxymethylenebutenolidase
MPKFFSRNKEISIEQFLPHGAGPNPAVIVVHGLRGAQTPVEQYAPLLTRFGYAVFILKYFESTESQRPSWPEIQQHFTVWLNVLSDAVTWVAQQPSIDAERIALLGVSLGAFLSLSLASVDTRIAAVVDLFGGMPDFFVDKATRMPPVLIIHGESDELVPVSDARKVEALMQRLGATCESRIYSGHGHILAGTAAWDAAQRIYRFLENHLKHAAKTASQLQ